MTNNTLQSAVAATLSKNAADELAKFSDPSVDVADIKVSNTQDIGEMIGAASTTTIRIVAWCKKHLKGFPTEVRTADEKAIKAGLLKHKVALDAAKGKDVELAKIGEDRYVSMAEWLKTHGANGETQKVETFNASGAAIMAMSGKKIGKMPHGKGTLHSFVAPRRKAMQTYVANRYNAFLSYAVRLDAAVAEEALLEKGKAVPVDARPVISREVKLAKVFHAALQDAKDGEFGTVSEATLTKAVDAFWDAIGIEAPELDEKGQLVEQAA